MLGSFLICFFTSKLFKFWGIHYLLKFAQFLNHLNNENKTNNSIGWVLFYVRDTLDTAIKITKMYKHQPWSIIFLLKILH